MRATRGSQLLALTGALALALAACGDDDGGESDGEADGGEAAEGQDGEFTTSLTFGTGGTAGVYFPLGTEYANLFEEHIDDVTVNAIETDASVDNLGRIFQGEMQIGLTQNNTAIDAVTGAGEFEGMAIDNIGWLGQLYPEAAQVITLEDSGFESIEDLEGQRISVGPPGSGTQAVAEAILSAHGIEEGDYEAFEESFGDARSRLQDGNLDASIEILGVPAGSLDELAATHDVQLLPIEESIAESIASETDFEAYTIPQDAYDFNDGDVSTVSVFAGVAASTTQVSPELGYELTRVIYEHAGDISLAQGDLITVEEALNGRGDLELHPGAQQYFEEQGLL
ncbi:TAXI family TRAP transporter solute-binding subunit [Actinobacteria bacterium YIM 96077]|uniref:TRAP transporter substrate-binding protein n=1 Tax=Phytoactinopolyspora halophila TaxID=1981511 RepID=A0A329QZ05_9ACTN|nr:TAXI family TRAP transporter solute-binding subunit [Phytoactinopolyspora halophila]AYY13262.1 TAXI family TRAP transporter solute-binding subunit [Actinobacteria bacterium YIM 96077]RAW17501.1 TRAP transporter substrate-binding protein [Phytoactinopolyspora halophila]